jgi:AcrR family transcriptional regulator
MELDHVSNVPVVAGGMNDGLDEQLPAGLSEPQIAVLQLLAAGRTLTEAAKGANVSRTTIYRWLREDQMFIVAQQRIREQMRRVIKMDVAAMAEDALLNVRMAISQGNDPRLCLALLKYLGLLRPDDERGGPRP